MVRTQIACENSCFSSLLPTWDVSSGETSALQRQKFHTDDVKSVQNLVRSPDFFFLIGLHSSCIVLAIVYEGQTKTKSHKGQL